MRQSIKTAVLASMVVAPVLAGAESWTLSSPDKSVRFTLTLEDSLLSYQVSHGVKDDATTVVEASPLGLIRSDEAFTNGFVFVAAGKPKRFDETYTLLHGKTKEVRNHGVEQGFDFTNANGAPVRIVVRAFNDGVAFAFRFPEETGQEITILSDVSGFKIPEGRAWMLPYDAVGLWAPAYEAFWENDIAVGTSSAEGKRGWCFPALFNVRDRWVMLAEAGLDGSCFASHLQPDAPDGLYRLRPPEVEETYGVAPQEATATLPWQSPWRVIVVGSTPATIVETSIIENLNPPCAIEDTSWIKPGRVSWSWWSNMSSPGDYDKLVPFVDLAAKLNWEYSLIDAGWPNMKNGDIWQLNEYAAKQGVGLILWYNSGGKHSQILDCDPRDRLVDPATRRAEMAMLQKKGIKGIKVDFMQSDKQYMIQLYLDIIRDAADHQIAVNFHGSTMPTGWSRTYPNLLTMESIAGAEQYWSEDFAEKAHNYHSIYTYTRNVVGPMDYTPVIFGNAQERKPHLTTNPHELATSVAFESGMQHFADSVENYLATPDYVQEFLRHVPVAWDETRYLDGVPGKLSLLARRKGKVWYVAGLNGEATPKTVTVPMHFLKRGTYDAELIYDADEPRDFNRRTLKVKSKDTLPVEVAGRGGFVIRISK
jgi:alpha-glucosidase